MRRISVLVPLLAVAVPSVAQAPAIPEPAPRLEPPAAMQTIGHAELLRHAEFLASDALGGRLTGSPGQEAAAKYIAGHFARLGLEPLGDERPDGQRSWFQDYRIIRTAITPDTRLEVAGQTFTAGFSVLANKPTKVDFTGEARFVGLGRMRGPSAEVERDANLEGVIPVVLAKTPSGKVDKNLGVEQKFMMSFQTFGRLGRTAQNLAKAGAKMIVFVMPDDAFGMADVLNYMGLAHGKDALAPGFQGGDRSMEMMSSMVGGRSKVPVVVMSEAASRDLLVRLGVELEAARKFLAGDGELPASKPVPATVKLEVVRDEDAVASNVCAVLRGSDPDFAHEAIVYSAHMDHVGTRMDGDVFNGADDNASGSAGLLGIASAYAKSKEKPRRSIIFLSVSGEELGLWGSKFYAENPTWKVSNLIANINTDMIGRSGPESGPFEVTVTPSFRHKMFSSIVQRSAALGETLGMTFTSGDKYYQRSDHYNFAVKGIPVVFFCNGEHEDYHQVSDHVEKLDADKMERIARLAFWTGWETANADERPQTLGRQQGWK
ncbi:MAG: M20/M25/M40 family metallo-hydrolase [bacterium]|nr:M20/M25/M40 family metallo-hydrolase [bacterium]